jgi:hypothetical protein
MQEIMEQLKAYGAVLNPPATPEAIASLETKLGTSLPAELKAVYAAFDGMCDNGKLWFFLSNIEEVLNTYDEFSDLEFFDEIELTQLGIPIANHEHGTLVYLTLTECPDRIVYIPHESSVDLSRIRWASMADLLQHACGGNREAISFYPDRAGERSDDGDAADACIARWLNTEGDEWPVFFLTLACNILPKSRLNEMLGWLEKAPLYHMRTIYWSLAERWPSSQANSDALPALEAAMLRAEKQGGTGTINGDLGWIAGAIASFGTREARDTLLRLGNKLSPHSLRVLEKGLKSLNGRVTQVSNSHALEVGFSDLPEAIMLIGRPVDS